MTSSSAELVDTVNILDSQLCVLNSYSTYVAVSLLTIVILSTVCFYYQAYSTFYSIIRLCASISSYCSDPRGYGSRYLLSIAFIIGYLLILLLIEEEQIRSVVSMASTQQMIQFYLQLAVNMCLPLVGIFYVRGRGPLQNQYYRLGISMKLPIALSEWIHNLSAHCWLSVMIFYNTSFAFDNYYVANATRTNNTLAAMIYLISSLIALLSCLFWYGVLITLTIYEDDFDDNLTCYCPDCTPNELYKTGKPWFQLTEALDKNACPRCLRSSPIQGGSFNVVDGKNEFRVIIEYQEKQEEDKRPIYDWLRLNLFKKGIEYKTYTQLHAYSFITEGIALFGTAFLAISGSILRKSRFCEQIGFAF